MMTTVMVTQMLNVMRKGIMYLDLNQLEQHTTAVTTTKNTNRRSMFDCLVHFTIFFPPELGVDIHVVILFNFFLSLLRFLMIFFYLVVFLFFNAFRKKGSFFSRISSENGSK